MPAIDNQRLYASLTELSVVPQKQLDEAYQVAVNQKESLASVLLNNTLIEEKNLSRLIADILGLPFVDLSLAGVDQQVLESLPQEMARKQRLVAFKKDANGLHLAMVDPGDIRAIDYIKQKTNGQVKVYLATEADINSALDRYAKDIKADFEKIIASNVATAKGATQAEPPIIKIVDTLLQYANEGRASDIHLEPTDNQLLVRFRIDGLLNDVLTLPQKLHPAIVSRIKVLAGLPTDIHAAALDGHMSQVTNQEELDIRVSIMPTTHGEKVVLRLLSERSRQYSLSTLGLSEKNLEKIHRAYQNPYGMILATGPTGSGKTTTLYTILKLINTRTVNIMTIEDPVEYELKGVNQIQVNPKTDLTFAKGLRSIVRQDPDIILVGEIRDEETAQIATNAALTGHLMFSTIHTNDAATTIPRLIDMKAEPFLIASTVKLIIAQRLVRRVCTACRLSKQVDLTTISDRVLPELLEKYLGSAKSALLFEGKGCPVCYHTGFLGRIGIFEIMEINNRLRDAIVSSQSAARINELAIQQGMSSMLEDGLMKVSQGVTTLGEVLAVTRE